MNIKKSKKKLKEFLITAKRKLNKASKKVSKIAKEIENTMDAIKQASSQYSEVDHEEKKPKKKKS
jgi:hypothetical protein